MSAFAHRASHQKGISLLSTIVTSLLVALSMGGFSLALASALDSRRQVTESVKAELAAVELLEFFQSLTATELRTVLSTNRANGSTAPLDLYRLCSHANLLDRDSGSALNPDPLAEINPSVRLQQANRFYQVQVINTQTQTLVDAKCNQTAATAVLNPNERFLVTVGVSWEGPKKVQRVALSGVVL